MEASIITAIVSSISAVIVAITSIIINSRNQKKNSIELERFKFSLEQEKLQNIEAKKVEQENLQAINSALELSQRVKDKISALNRELLFTEKINMNKVKEIKKDIQEYDNLFSKIFQNFDYLEANLLHEIKVNLHSIDKILFDESYIKEEKEAFVEMLDLLRVRISELQQSLIIKRLR